MTARCGHRQLKARPVGDTKLAGDKQTKPGSLMVRRKKRLKNLLTILQRNTGAVVQHMQFYPPGLICKDRLDPNRSLPPSRVPQGITHQIP